MSPFTEFDLMKPHDSADDTSQHPPPSYLDILLFSVSDGLDDG